MATIDVWNIIVGGVCVVYPIKNVQYFGWIIFFLVISWVPSHSWWRHQMETFSALLALCAGNSLVIGELPSQRPVTRSFDVFFDLRLNKRLSKQSWGGWFETPSHSLWRHSNDIRQVISLALGKSHDYDNATEYILKEMCRWVDSYSQQDLANLEACIQFLGNTVCLIDDMSQFCTCPDRCTGVSSARRWHEVMVTFCTKVTYRLNKFGVSSH